MRYKQRLARLEVVARPARKIYRVRFVGSAAERDEIIAQRRRDEGDDYQDALPGEIRFIMADSWLPAWREETPIIDEILGYESIQETD